LVLSACAIVLAVLGLTPGLQRIPEVPLVAAAALAAVGACASSGAIAAHSTPRARPTRFDVELKARATARSGAASSGPGQEDLPLAKGA